MTAKEERAMVLKTLSEISERMDILSERADIMSERMNIGIETIKSLQREVNALKRRSKDLLPVISSEPEENLPKRKRENKFNPDDYKRIEVPDEYDLIDDSVSSNRKSRPPSKKVTIFCEDCRKDIQLSPVEAAGKDLSIPYRCPQARTANGCHNKQRRR